MKHRSGRWALVAALGVVGACTLETKTVSGPQGEKGEKGEQGAPGMADPTQLAALKAQIDTLQTKMATLEKQAADPDCPAGYTLSPNPAAPGVVRCVLGPPGQEYDEVVKVGSGASSFWIDRYEASVWDGEDGVQYGAVDASNNYPKTFPLTGQRSPGFIPLYARSRPHVPPSGWPSWFQAVEACASSGKRLPNGQEWLRAASGTVDPGHNDGAMNTFCNTVGAARQTAAGGSCVSAWGAEDMIGNVAEWTSEWYAGLGNKAPSDLANFSPNLSGKDAWPFENGDATSNIASDAWSIGGALVPFLPAAAIRGGGVGDGPAAGVFTLNLEFSPASGGPTIGFRCVIPR